LSELGPTPCPKWAKKLAALHPEDLSTTEREQLSKHLARCARCAAVLNDYHAMDTLIRNSLIIERPLQLREIFAAEKEPTTESIRSQTGLQSTPTKRRSVEKVKAAEKKFKALPEDLKHQLQKGIVDFLVHHAEEMGNQITEALSQLSSQTTFYNAFDQAIMCAIQRFIAEHTLKDADLVALILADTHFWESQDVRQRLKALIRLPDYWLVEERATMVQHFPDVLPQQTNRVRVDRVITFFLRCIVEELWTLPGVEEICAIYNLQFQKVGAEAARRHAASLRAQLQSRTQLDTEVRQALLQLALALERRFLVGPYHNLPQPDYSRFVGRQKDLDWLHHCLLSGDNTHCVVITGVAGAGKSALALALAHHYLERYKDLQPEERFEAILWLSSNEKLSTIKESEKLVLPNSFFLIIEDIYTAIARMLGRKDITRALDEEKRHHLVQKALSAQRTLLIIDNLESITDERVRTFLSNLPPSTKCLITTRKWERVPDKKRHLRGLPSEEAEKMVTEEIKVPHLELNEIQLEQLLECTGRMPLSIKLSMGRLASGETFEQVMQWLENTSGNLPEYYVKGQLDLIRRQNPKAWRLLLACSLFDQTAGASREALGFIADILSTDRDDELVLLQCFSLLNRDENGRFWLLPIIQQFAGIDLLGTDLGEVLTERWLSWLLNFAQNNSADLEFHVERVPKVGPEYPNLLNAIRWCRRHKRWATLLELAEGTSFYPYLLDLLNELKEILEAGLQASRALSVERREGRFLRQIGRLFWKQGQHEKALEYLDESRKIACRYEDEIELGRADNIRFEILYRQGHMLEAEQVAQAMWERGKQCDNLELKILAVYQLAQCESKKGQFDKALEWLDRSEEWCRELGWWRRLAWNMYLRGVTLSQQGNILGAEPYLIESLRMAASWNEHYLIALNKHILTEVYAEANRLHLALQMIEEAHNLYERLGMNEELEQVEELLRTLPRKVVS